MTAPTIMSATFIELARLPIREDRAVVVSSSELPLRPCCLQLELQRPPAPPLRITVPGHMLPALRAALDAFEERAAAVARMQAKLPAHGSHHRPGVPRGRTA